MEDIREYVKRYEEAHPVRESAVPTDPSKRWFRKDALTECVDKCKYALFETAMREARMARPTEPMTAAQRLGHARYAALVPMCVTECESTVPSARN